MLLDKLQRHAAYIIMLAEFRGHSVTLSTGSWFCYLIWDLFRLDDDGFSNDDDYNGIGSVMKHLPELHKLFKEIHPCHHDFETREQILKQCIAETYEP
jgi:hypothetical protein